jgi:multiple sugar transport system permease protein
MPRKYFLTIPMELVEGGMFDGATRLRALRSVVLPVAMPGIAATGIFSYILSWNEFL